MKLNMIQKCNANKGEVRKFYQAPQMNLKMYNKKF